MNSLSVTLFSNKWGLICLHTVKWFQVLLISINNSLFNGVSTFVGYLLPKPCF